MHSDIGNLRLQQLNRDLESFRAARSVPRPEKGWIRAVRSAMGVSTGDLGRILGVSRQLPLQFEKAEADDSITLKSLRRVANALDCDLVYALTPRTGTTRERSPAQAKHKTIERIDLASEATAIESEPDHRYFCD